MANIEALKKQKRALKMTFDELSLKSGIPKRTLENIFHGVTPNPRIDTMLAIEIALELSRSVEWTEEEKNLGVSSNYRERLTKDEMELLDAYRAVFSEKGEKAAHAIKTMVEIYADSDNK